MNTNRKIKRRNAREFALLVLFQIFLGKNTVAESIEYVEEYMEFEDDFSKLITTGVLNNIDKIDSILQANMKKWSLNRIGNIEKNVLRIATFELCFSEERTDSSIILNEAIEIVKKYSDETSSKFVNSVLQQILEKSVVVKENNRY